MYDAVCLASGGLDSIVCLHLMRRQGIAALPVFINYNQRNLKREFGSLRDNVKAGKFPKPVIVDVSGFGKIVRSGLTDSRKKVLEEARHSCQGQGHLFDSIQSDGLPVAIAGVGKNGSDVQELTLPHRKYDLRLTRQNVPIMF